jgi:signal transduction histidine kinase
MFRRIFLINGYVMIVVGLLLCGWPLLFAAPPTTPPGFKGVTITDVPGASDRLLPDPSAPVVVYHANERTIFLGVSLIALGVASLAFGYSTGATLQRKAALYFLAGHLFLAFTVWTLATIWSAFAGFVVFDLLVWPIPALLYGLLPYRSVEASRTREAFSTEQEIRETAGQEERNRLAQDLHDSVKQQIYSVQTNLATAEARWDDDAAGARAAIEHARQSARDAMAEMSALLDRLRRDPIESVGLVEALRRQCEALGFQTGAAVTTAFGDLPPASCLPSGAMTPVFRIVQESLANIARHARAKHVALQLDTNTERNALFLEIRDDGCGFDTPSSSSAGMGLRNMRLRAEEVGAELDIQSKDGEGTVTRLWLPLIDGKRERIEHHNLRLLAALIPAIAAAGLMIFWQGSAPFLFPFVAAGGALAAFHLFALRKLKSA